MWVSGLKDHPFEGPNVFAKVVREHFPVRTLNFALREKKQQNNTQSNSCIYSVTFNLGILNDRGIVWIKVEKAVI